MHQDSCVPEACSCIGSTCNWVVCDTPGIPTNQDPPNPVRTTVYDTASDCTGEIQKYFAQTDGVCFTGNTISSNRASCAGTTLYDAPNCTGNSMQLPGASSGFYGCIFGGPNDSIYVDCPLCFHEDTKIKYAGQVITLSEMKKTGHPSCVIPHTYHSSGYQISTNCEGTLRVTGEHLVYTQNGLTPASAIKPGDFLFQDMDQKKACEVVKVEIEDSQVYHALNCEESTVLADGYKTSTFGIIHTIPALWMKYASKIIGIERASAWGEVLAPIFGGLFD